MRIEEAVKLSLAGGSDALTLGRPSRESRFCHALRIFVLSPLRIELVMRFSIPTMGCGPIEFGRSVQYEYL